MSQKGISELPPPDLYRFGVRFGEQERMVRKAFSILLIATILGILAFELSVRKEKAEANYGRCLYCQKWVRIGREGCCFSYRCRLNKFFTLERKERPLPE